MASASSSSKHNRSSTKMSHEKAINAMVNGQDGFAASDGNDGEPVDYKSKYRLQDMELKTTLGTGTFGRVVLAKHKPSKKYFALKILIISEVIRLKQVEHVKCEKSILGSIRHPFIVDMYWADHDHTFLYMLLDFMSGGELFSYLRNAGRFTSNMSNFFACEIVMALEYLHSLGIVYRDLKPENLLLDRDGHLKLTDFGFAKKLEDRTWTLCGTPEYLAPEIIQSKGHNKAVDWWALGVLIYEMIIGYPPFYDDNPFGIYQKIVLGKIDWPRHVDTVAKDLIRKLLTQDRTKRLGSMKNGTEDVKRHKWFRHIDWDDVYNKRIKPALLPMVNHRGDTRNFVNYPDDEDWLFPGMTVEMLAPIEPKIGSDGDTSNFDEFPEDGWKRAAPVKQEDLAQFRDF